MAGFKNGAVAIKKKDVGINADPNFINILVDTLNNLYTIDEFGIYRSIAGYDIVSSGSDISVVTSGGTKVLSLNSTGVVSGIYGNATTVPQIVIDNKGRILSAYNIPISATGLGTVTSISISSNTLNVINSPITTFGTFGVNLSATGVVSGSILKPFVDSYGRVLSGGLISATDISDRSTDVSLSANSDNKIPTEKAIKTYVDTKRLYISTGISVSIPPNFVNNNNGTLTIEPTTCRLYSTTDFTGNIDEYNVLGTTLALTDGIEQHVCVSYNSGNPIYYVENNHELVNDSNIICVYHVWRQGLEIHSLGMDSLGLGLGNKTLHAINNTTPYRKSYLGGLIISESVSPNPRTVIITSGNVYAGVVEQLVFPFNSSVDRLTLAYHNSGNWEYVDNLIYNNTQYDNGTNLATILNNKYSVRWFYRSIGDVKQTFYVLGSGNYNNLSDARLELPRTDLPMILLRHCVLVGRSIIEHNSSIGITEPISDVSFSQSVVQNHNDLQNIQGGIVGEYYHLNSLNYNSLINLSAIQEPTGFPNKNQSMSYNYSTKTFNISAIGGFDIFYRGNKFSKSSDSLVVSALGENFIYYTSAGVLTASQTVWDIATTVQVAYLYINESKVVLFAEERHGCVMDWATHKYAHKNFGTQYTSGFTANYQVNNNNISFGLTNGVISDEDLELTISNGVSGGYFTQVINSSAYIPVYYHLTASPYRWTKDVATAFPYKTDGVQIQYDILGGGGPAPTSNNNFVSYYIFATNNISEPIISIMGQRQDTSLANAEINQTPALLNLEGFPSQEAKLLYQIILQKNTSYGNVYDARIQKVIDYRLSDINLINAASGGDYLPLAGGTLTGPITGTSATFSDQISAIGSVYAGSLVLPQGTLRQNHISSLYGSLYGSSVSPASTNYSFAWNVSGTDTAINSTLTTRINVNDVSIVTAKTNGLEIGDGKNISWLANPVQLGPPTLNTRTPGTRLLMWPSITSTLTDYSIGMESTSMWFGLAGSPGANEYFRWYNGTRQVMNLTCNDGVGNLSVAGSVSATSFIKSGGTSAQFLKANGSIDSNSYVTTTSFGSSSDYFVQGNGGNYGKRTSLVDQFDTYLHSGFYDAETPYPTEPAGNFWTHLIRSVHSQATVANYWAFDIAASFANGTGGSESYFMRINSPSGWGTWRQLWHTGNFTPGNYATTASTNRPANEVVYGSGSGITSSPIIKALPNSTGFSGIEINNPSSSFGSYIALVTSTNTSGRWYLQKRDLNQFNSTTGSFVIEDSSSGVVNSRYPMIIDAGGSGLIKFQRNISATGTVSATNFYNSGNYYVSNYSGGGTPSLITNNGNAKFYILTLTDYWSPLVFSQAKIGSFGPSGFFNNGSYSNTIRIYGRDSGTTYAGIEFGTYYTSQGTEYIGSKNASLYLGSSNNIYLNSNSNTKIASTYGSVILSAYNSTVDITSYTDTNIISQAGWIKLTCQTTNGIELNTGGYVTITATNTAGLFVNSVSSPTITVTATEVTAAGLSVSLLPDKYDYYILSKPVNINNYKNYRLPTPGFVRKIICYIGSYGPYTHPVIHPPNSGSIFDSSGNIVNFVGGGSDGGAYEFVSDESGNWWMI